MLFDSPEQLGIVALHPFVKKGFIVVEDEIRILIAKIGCHPVRRNRLGQTLLPRPEPHWVQMSIADQKTLLAFRAGAARGWCVRRHKRR